MNTLKTIPLFMAVVAVAAAAFSEEATQVLELELPEPYFEGTPIAYFGENLEERSFKPRPEFLVPEGTTNVAAGKPVSASVDSPAFGKFSMLNDGDKSFEQKSLLGIAEGDQWIQIDLGKTHAIYAIVLWHFHEGERVYFDVKIETADNAAFTKNVQAHFNNDHDNSADRGVGEDKEYIEDYKGRFIETKDALGRYVRFHSNGNTTDNFNHYVEAEVFGKPVE